MVHGTITKTGNSYAIRVPKRFIDDNNLKLGDVIDVEEPLLRQRQALDNLIQYTKNKAGPDGISDPVVWQRKQRDWSERRGNPDR